MKRLTAGMAAFLAAGALASFNAARADEPSKSEDSRYYEKIVQLYATDAPDGKKPAGKTDGGWRTLVFKEGEAEGASGSDVWIGAEVNMPTDELRKKLDLPKDEGVVVQQVVPDSPAAKAGLKVGDVLLSAGDKPLKELADALGAVRSAKDGKVNFLFLRDGKKDQMTLKPVNRPAEFALSGELAVPPASKEAVERRVIVKLLDKSDGSPDLAKIRAELRSVREQIVNIEHQLVEIEKSRAGNDRAGIIKQMAALKRAINELNEGGRTEDAERLKKELRELGEKMQGGEMGIETPLRGALNLTSPTGNAFYVADGDGLKFTLSPTGSLAAQGPATLKLTQPLPTSAGDSPSATVSELRKEVERLRRELSELREQAAKKEKR